MPSRSRTLCVARVLLTFALALFFFAPQTRAQEDGFDEETDPFKLFERCQTFHERGDEENLKLALECYDETIKLKPEFPEAEFQKGAALLALNRLPESEQAFRRAGDLRPEWSHPRAWLGVLLARQSRDRDAEPVLRRALELEADNFIALSTLADLRTRAADAREAATLWRRAIAANPHAKASHWFARGEAERAAGDTASALKSFESALRLDPTNVPARVRRAEINVQAGTLDAALEELKTLREPAKTDAKLALRVADLYARAGRKDEALAALDALPEAPRKSAEVANARAGLTLEGEETPQARETLEKLAAADPQNASLQASLGATYRTDDPQKSLQHYRRAVELEPSNARYAAGYGAALVQARKFAEAASLLRKVVAAAPRNYTAHANLATALDGLKLYREALVEYNWLSRERPELAVTYFLMARAHDLLGEFPEALALYETFVARADAKENYLEIEKVKLRLPSLRNQIKRGEGAKKK